ncbi:MAG: response regulator transcription factor [Motiliproteus sp.]
MNDYLNILVADSSPLCRHGIAISLKSANCACNFIEASSFLEISKLILDNPTPDLLVVDSKLPDIELFHVFHNFLNFNIAVLTDNLSSALSIKEKLQRRGSNVQYKNKRICSTIPKTIPTEELGIILSKIANNDEKLNLVEDFFIYGISKTNDSPLHYNHIEYNQNPLYNFSNKEKNNIFLQVKTGTNSEHTEIISNRENEVLHGIRLGLSNKQIAKNLNISISTVKSHVGKMLTKLEANNRTQLIIKTRRKITNIKTISHKNNDHDNNKI